MKTNKTLRKVLILAPYPVVPTDTGAKIRVYEIAHGLSVHGMQVTVLVPMNPAQYFQKEINANLRLKPVPYPFVLPFLFTDKPFPYMVLISLHPGYHRFIEKYLNTCDIIQFEGVSFGDLIYHIHPNKKVVYDAHNVEYDYVKSETRRQWVRDVSTRRIHKLEHQLVHRADRILTCSTQDAERISELYQMRDQKFTVIPNGVHLNQKTSQEEVDRVDKLFPRLLDYSCRVIFSGSDVAHNRAAVRFLIERVASQLRQDCAFIIKGQCGNGFKNYRIENVFFDASPGDVGPYANICTVALNPVIQGSGTSLKVLDYLAHGLPVVSTEFGMRGYEDLKEWVTLSEPDHFAETLRGRSQFYDETTHALKKYTWQSVVETLYNTLNKQLV